MLSYFVLSLGVSLYIVAAFDLVWWMFLLVLAVFLLLGAEWSRIFEQQEIVDLAYATALISAAVWLVFGGVNSRLEFIVCGVTVSGLIVHELSHKAVGLGFGKYAEFNAFYTLNLGSVAVAYLTGLLLLAPGAVTFNAATDRAYGLVAAAGPVSNLILAVGFLAVGDGYPALALIGFLVNLALAGFNMLPVPPLDGSKVLRWSPVAYAVIGTPIVALVYMTVTSL